MLRSVVPEIRWYIYTTFIPHSQLDKPIGIISRYFLTYGQAKADGKDKPTTEGEKASMKRSWEAFRHQENWPVYHQH